MENLGFKYRIKEFNNKFTVQKFTPERYLIYFPFLVSKKIPEGWVNIDYFGNVINNWNEDRPDTPEATFKSLKKAKEFITELKNPPKPIYYYE